MSTMIPSRLVLSTIELHRAAAELLTGRELLARAHIHRNFTRTAHEYLLSHYEFAESVFPGQAFPATDDFAALTGPNDHVTAQQVLDQAALRPGQTLVLVRLGLGTDRSQWQGCIAGRTSLLPLDEIHLIGPKMTLIQRASADETSTPPESSADSRSADLRWSRLVGAIGSQTVQVLQRQKLLLIGAGRNGSLMAESLVRLGVKQLYIVDADDLGLENLDATFGSTPPIIGQPKVKALARHLSRMRSRTQIIGMRMDARDPRIIDYARQVDIIVTCVDTDAPRLAAAKLASRFLRVHLDVGSVVRSGSTAGAQAELGIDVRLLLPGSCIACVGGLRDLAGAQRSLERPVLPLQSGLSRGIEFQTENSPSNFPSPSTGKTGSLISLNEIAVGSGVQLLLDLLGGSLLRSHWLRTVWKPGNGPQTESASVTGDENCQLCRPRF